MAERESVRSGEFRFDLGTATVNSARPSPTEGLPLLDGSDPTREADVCMDATGALRTHFGFEEFLDGQEHVVGEILAGRDGLVVMPTGGGKSLCYQLPAMCLEGVTLVVSPLIALMKDQVDALEGKGVPATLINSTLSAGEQRERISRMRAGHYKLVYVAPERFRADGFVAAMKEVEVSMLAIDEAHCLSQWGHDFRPDYMRLGEARKAMGDPQCVAFTATATPVVRQDLSLIHI